MRTPSHVLALAVAATCAFVTVATLPTQASPSRPHERYVPIAKERFQPPPVEGERVLEVKFATSVTLEGARVATPAHAQAAAAVLNGSSVESVQPLFASQPQELQALAAEGERASGKEATDLNRWLHVTVAKGVNPADVVRQLMASPDIEIAYVRPKSVRPPAPDYTAQQGYLYSPEADYGINAAHAHSLGATGKGITVADIEFGWQTNHEDLTKLRNATVTQGTAQQDHVYHGTSVMGEILADKNSFGVTGIAYDAQAMISHVSTRERGFSPASAIATAAARLSKGDVLIVELQTPGCRGGGGGGGYVAEEYIPSVYDAVRAATSKGIYVLEAAGNGSENTDASCYGSPFPSGRADSGAIIVGAGAGKVRNGEACGTPLGKRQSFSSYGSRVTSFAWGRCVMTTTDGNTYTNAFSGTSSATPIVTGAVAILAGIIRERGLSVSPQQMRDLIARTGTPSASGQGIGSMPDLKKAIADLGGSTTPTPTPTVTPTSSATPTASPTSTPTVDPTVDPTTDPTVDPTTDPTPGPGSQVINGDFEQGPSEGWSGDTYIINTKMYAARSGSYKAFLQGYGRAASEKISQKVRLGAAPKLTFALNIRTSERGSKAYDTMRVQVLDAAGKVSTLATFSNVDADTGYTLRTLDLTSFKGQEVTLQFIGNEDSSLATSFLVDDVQLS